jgi:hypothetical protein
MATAAELLAQTEAAIEAVLAGAQSYTIGDYTVTRPSLSKLFDQRLLLKAEAEREARGQTAGPTFRRAVRGRY